MKIVSNTCIGLFLRIIIKLLFMNTQAKSSSIFVCKWFCFKIIYLMKLKTWRLSQIRNKWLFLYFGLWSTYSIYNRDIERPLMCFIQHFFSDTWWDGGHDAFWLKIWPFGVEILTKDFAPWGRGFAHILLQCMSNTPPWPARWTGALL